MCHADNRNKCFLNSPPHWGGIFSFSKFAIRGTYYFKSYIQKFRLYIHINKREYNKRENFYSLILRIDISWLNSSCWHSNQILHSQLSLHSTGVPKCCIKSFIFPAFCKASNLVFHRVNEPSNVWV